MREVEIKFQVPDIEQLLRRLSELGCDLGESVREDDLVFNHQEQRREARCVLRIRTSGSASVLTLKKDIINELDCLEIETGVSDPDATKRLLMELGYQPAVRVTKGRRRGKWDNWEICVDEVDGLGAFIEVEALYPDGEVDDNAQENLWQAVVSKLRVENLSRVNSGYDTLIARSGQVYIGDNE